MAQVEPAYMTGVRAVKNAWQGMLAIQLCLVMVVAGYFLAPEFAAFLGKLADLKDKGGVFSAILAGFVSGGLVPEIAKSLIGKGKNREPGWVADMLYAGFVYSIISVLVFFLYKLLDGVFGPSTTFGALAGKVLFDMLVFSPFLSIPLAFHLFGFRDEKFSTSYLRNIVDKNYYISHVWPPLVMCWAFWGPAVTCIYLFPERIQFVLAFFCQGAWSLIFVLMVREKLVRAPVE